MLRIKMECAVLPIKLLVCFSLFPLGPAWHAAIKINVILFSKKKTTAYLLISKVDWLLRENEYHKQMLLYLCHPKANVNGYLHVKQQVKL